MNKICTSIEQSQKLIKLRIDVNTADMCWQNNEFPIGFNDNDAVPAWSLSALLGLLFQPSLHNTAFGGWRCDYYKGPCWTLGESSDNPIDAVFNSVVSLLENKKI